MVKGMPGLTQYARDGCNVNQVTHCCQEMTTTDDAYAIQILHELGFPIDSNAVVVGKKCTEHDGNNCVASPVCCSGNLDHETALNCSPVNHNGVERD
ncbi:hypothetical protein AGABI2DRAFT_137582 [Agaricus bisporus var. bisporus H97]|uniref:hypothetical protein n=1 Tax=Agaricus bisporus var. bisporus (strain H97 / ATCC MYA-4626 / FGSC 10389) TaxID=936046 RepID=UPI00029F7652|nr:hypothetical protein AGABI2DRAFT_137582 [Agaricus bisporus var. bisporus H97]EKV46160.1 hypothetical protein AGABI2DRAFT_137582 [Agaricus bisporus var. bisporus H97]